MTRLTAEVLLVRPPRGRRPRGCGTQDSRRGPAHPRPATRLRRRVLEVGRFARAGTSRARRPDTARVHDLGDENAQPWLLFLLGDVERTRKARSRARMCPHRGEAAEQSGQPLFAGHNLALESLVQAQLVAPARRETPPAAAGAGATMGASSPQRRWATSASSSALRRRPSRNSSRRSRSFGREAIAEPGASRFAVDLIEARRARAAGRRPEILDWYESNARRLGAPLCPRQLPTLPRPPCGSGRRARHRARRLRGGARGTPCRDPARSRSDAAGPGSRSASRETTARGARDTGECPRRLRRDRCRALAERARGELRRISGVRRRRARSPPPRNASRPSSPRVRRIARSRPRLFPTGRSRTPHSSESSVSDTAPSWLEPRLPSITGDREVKHGGLDRFGRAGRSVASRQGSEGPPEDKEKER